MSEVEERPRFVTGGYGRHRSQWVKPSSRICYLLFSSEEKYFGALLLFHKSPLSYTNPYYTVYFKSRVLTVFPSRSDASTHFYIKLLVYTYNVVQTTLWHWWNDSSLSSTKMWRKFAFSFRNINNHLRRKRVGTVVRAFASHQCGSGSIPLEFVLSLLLVLAPRVFLRVLRFSSLLKN